MHRWRRAAGVQLHQACTMHPAHCIPIACPSAEKHSSLPTAAGQATEAPGAHLIMPPSSQEPATHSSRLSRHTSSSSSNTSRMKEADYHKRYLTSSSWLRQRLLAGGRVRGEVLGGCSAAPAQPMQTPPCLSRPRSGGCRRRFKGAGARRLGDLFLLLCLICLVQALLLPSR